MKKTGIIIISVIVYIVFLIIGIFAVGRLVINRRHRNKITEIQAYSQESTTQLTYETEPVAEKTTTQKTDSSQSKVSLDKEDLHRLNLFLSNFSEIYHENYYIDTDDEDGILEFIITNTFFNIGDKFSKTSTVYHNDISYSRAVDAAYIQQRVYRYFGINVKNQSAGEYYYHNGLYYIPDADGEFLPYFSKVTRITSQGSGKVYVEYDIYRYNALSDNVINNKSSIYYGYGAENTDGCTRCGSGTALLTEKYFKEDYANYIVDELKYSNRG